MSRNQFLSLFFGLIWALLGFSAALDIVHRATPGFSPEDPMDIQRAKSGLHITPPANADVIVIGTSHLFRGFNPERFERETGLSAYNLSFNGMSAPEMAHMATYVARIAKAKKVKHVILEGRGFALPSDGNLTASRVIHASRPQDWDKYKPVSPTIENFKYWKPRIQATLGISRLQSYGFMDRPDDYVSIIETGEFRRRELKEQGIVLPGSSPLKKTVRTARSNLKIIESKGFGYQDREIKPEAQVEMRRKYQEISKWKRKSKLSQGEKSHYLALIQMLKDAGVKTHIVLPPTISPEWMRTHDKFADGALKVPTYDLRIHLYSEEFGDLKNWADHGHLNGKGAEVFTDLLAEKFLKSATPKTNQKAAQISLTSSKINLPECEVTQP